MNRRQFTTALSAIASLPMMPLRSVAAAPVVATTVPNTARFWAIYMSQMHGNCSAKTLATMTGLDVSAAQNCLTSLISDGVITPTRLMSNVVGSQANKPTQPSKWKERVQKFIDEKQSLVTEDLSEEIVDDAIEDDIVQEVEE